MSLSLSFSLQHLPPSISMDRNPNLHVHFHTFSTRSCSSSRIRCRISNMAAASGEDNGKSTKLVTFLGKGGSGKTTAAVFAAQHCAKEGLSTCLVTHSQDRTAEYLLNTKIETVPTMCSDNLSAVRLATTKILLEPLKRLKQADAHVNLTQGVLEGIIGEELGVLPGLDSLFSCFVLERFIGFLGIKALSNQRKDKYDVIIYDGISSEETLRMINAANTARLYLKHLRSMAEKTDLGRLAGPSLLRLVDETMSLNASGAGFNGKLSSEVWDSLERVLKRGSSAFTEAEKFGCYIVMDPSSTISVDTALRYWGCAIQAGARVSGAFGIASPHFSIESTERIKAKFSPLSLALIPHLSSNSPLDWDRIMLNAQSTDARNLLNLTAKMTSSNIPSVTFDAAKRSITLFMPGFDKSEIKLYQYRGGSELLVEAGDQRRVIQLPREVQGKVAGAKFTDRSLVITMR